MQFNDRVYGTIIVDDPIAIAIINHPSFDRLNRIKQNGPFHKSDPRWTTTRAQHSIGVYHLLRLFGASRDEQLAGLVHDANHLAFSHLIDWLVGDSEHQEGHNDFIGANPHLAALSDLVDEFGLDGQTVINYKLHSLLEQPTPLLCADRIDYTFRDGLCAQQVASDEIAYFLQHLVSVDGQFAMNDLDAAEKFSRLSIDLHIIRESDWGNALYLTICKILRRAMAPGLIVKSDFLLDDEHLYAKMRQLDDASSRLFFDWESAGAPIERGYPNDFDLQAKCKIRYIDPPVTTSNGLKRASELRPGLATLIKHYELLRGNTLQMKYPSKFSDLTKL